MKSAGFGLLATIVRDRIAFSTIIDSGITDKFLIKAEKTVYEFIFEFYRQHGRYPSFETINRETKTDLSGYPEEPFSYWVEQVYKRRILRVSVSESNKIIEHAREGRVEDAVDVSKKLSLAMLKLNPSASIHWLTDLSKHVMERHDKLQRAGTLVFGASFGFPYFDEISGGAQPGDFIALAGRPGTGKSFVLFKMVNSAHDNGGRPALVTFEMPANQCARRIIAMRSQSSTTQLRIGRLSHFGRKKVLSACNLIANDVGWELPIIQGSSSQTVEDLLAMVQDIGADSLFIDGAYFLHTQRRVSSKFERISEVADVLKNDGAMRKGHEMPVIATYQFNKRAGKTGGGLGDIYMSDDMSQLGSMVFKLYNDEETDGAGRWSNIDYKIIELLKGREGERGKIRVKYDMMNTVIEQDEILSDYRSFFQET